MMTNQFVDKLQVLETQKEELPPELYALADRALRDCIAFTDQVRTHCDALLQQGTDSDLHIQTLEDILISVDVSKRIIGQVAQTVLQPQPDIIVE